MPPVLTDTLLRGVPLPTQTRQPDVSLPVLETERSCSAPKLSPSRMGKWRALVLILVHMVIAIHVVQWLVTGMTISPVEPSESMQTLELGLVNAGFVMFALALLSTALLGRYFCGWACHVVALQDLCAWLMRRCRIHPKPFRSRLLILAPLGLGLYMFVWPAFKRGILKPALAAADIPWPTFLAKVPPLAGLHNEFLVEDFWATFPPWYVAIPFLAICGFATVYFLGSKGFCTYGCPYGGFFAPLDKLAPVRIRVNDSCEQCGHCTATCTSNVRVHEEVRDYGMVVDPGCMKCMDCVSVCPNDALYVGLGRPAVLKKLKDEQARRTAERAAASRERRYDLTRREEWAVAALWIGFFLAFRGMLGLVPMLMAGGFAGIAAWGTWKLWRLARDVNVRAQNVQLKRKGAWRPAGVVFAVFAVTTILAAGWSGSVRALRWSAAQTVATLDVPIDAAFRPEFAPSPADFDRAGTAAARYHRADTPAGGGFGWSLDPDALVDVAYLHVLRGEWAEAEAALERVIETGRPLDALVFQLGQIMTRRGAGESAVRAMLGDALDRHPRLHRVRTAVARSLLTEGRRSEAIELWETALAGEPDDPAAQVEAARFFAAADQDRARTLAREAMAGAEDEPTRLDAAELLIALGDRSVAEELSETTDVVRTASLLARAGETARARETLAQLSEKDDPRPRLGQLTGGAELAFALGEPGLGRALLDRAAAAPDAGPWDRLGVGNVAARLGAQAGDAALLDLGESILRELVAAHPDEPLFHHDLALILIARGEPAAALPELERAAERGENSAELATRAAQLAMQLGVAERADRWRAEARRRR